MPVRRVRVRKQNTITAAPSRTASARRPSGVERSVTTWRPTFAFAEQLGAALEQLLGLALNERLALGVGLVRAWRT